MRFGRTNANRKCKEVNNLILKDEIIDLKYVSENKLGKWQNKNQEWVTIDRYAKNEI